MEEKGEGTAVVSSDHADASMNVSHLASVGPSAAPPAKLGPRLISLEEMQQHSGQEAGGRYWAVVDGFVVDATEFIDTHPGGLRKLLSADTAAAGATGSPFGFTFSGGRNGHFPDTGRRFRDGVKRFLAGTALASASSDNCLAPASVNFPPHGSLLILGLLRG